jgi:predicted HTH domain antitoxin
VFLRQVELETKKRKNMNSLEVELPPEIPVEEARLLLMVKLFETGRLSLGQAATLAGYSKSTFIELLRKLGVPVIDYPPEELEQEMNF